MGAGSTDEGRAEIEAIAGRHDVPADAVATLLDAIRRGGGRQAQFSHPALGGMGQWSRGGGIMIGDMFDAALKAKVERLCNELAEHVGDARLSAVGSGVSNGGWWPRDLGMPSSTGSQNDQAYAVFPDARRLAVRGPDGISLYDTGEHRLSGVSQQQGGGHDLVFTGPQGRVQLSDLTRVGAPEPDASGHEPKPDKSGHELGEAARREPAPARPSHAEPERRGSPTVPAGGDVLALVERLHDLERRGILTSEEFVAKKTELLARL